MVKYKVSLQQSLNLGKDEASHPETKKNGAPEGDGRSTAAPACGLTWPSVRTKGVLYAQLVRLDKPIGWLLLLWPTLWALWLANEGIPSLHLLAVFVLGVFLTRSAGAAVNDLVGRGFYA